MSTQSKTGNKYWKCLVCFKTFDLKSKYIRDTKIHEGLGLRCELCDKGLNENFICVGRRELLKHMVYHKRLGEVAVFYNLKLYPVGSPLPQRFAIKLYDIGPKDLPKKLEEIKNAKLLQGPLKKFSLALRTESQKIVHYNFENSFPENDQYTDRIIKCIEFIVEKQQTNLNASFRQLFYSGKELYGYQRTSDYSINSLKRSLNCSARDLNFVAPFKEEYIRYGKSNYECANVNFLKEEEFNYIVVSEKALYLDYLRTDARFEDCIFLNFKGQSSNTLREWMNSIPDKPVFGIVDADYYGISIWKATISVGDLASRSTLLACVDAENSRVLSKQKLTNLDNLIKSGDVIEREDLFEPMEKVDLFSFFKNELTEKLNKLVP